MSFNNLNKQQKIYIYITMIVLLVPIYFISVAALTVNLSNIQSHGINYIRDAIAVIGSRFSLSLPLRAIQQGFTLNVLSVFLITTLIVYLVIFLGTLMVSRNYKRKHVFGNAKWSEENSIQRNNLRAEKGIIVGRDNSGRLLKFGGQEFVSLGAPTRSGKGVGIVIPNLLEWENSLVVLDVKQECFSITSKYRKNILKQEVFLFNPFSFNTHRYNPLDYLDFSRPDIELQIQALAVSLYPIKGDKDFFVLQSQSIFVAIVYLLGRLREANLLASSFTLTTLAGSLQGVRLIQDEGSQLLSLQEVVNTAKSLGLLTDTISSKFHSFFEQAEAKDQFAGVKSSYETPLKVFQDPLFEMATACNDFDFRDLRKKKMTIYIGITPENISVARPIINLFFTQLIYENIRQGLPDTNPDLKHNVLLLMDEFTSIGYMEQYQTAIAYMAGYNLRSLIIYQNRTQLAENPPLGYGDKGSETLLENHSCQIIYRPKSPKTAEELSKRIGNITTATDNRSFSSRDSSVSRSQNTTQRALILPQEIMDLEDDEELIFCNSAKIKCKKALFYADPYFIDKLRLVSPTLQVIKGLPSKAQLEMAYSNKETSIPLPDQNKN